MTNQIYYFHVAGWENAISFVMSALTAVGMVFLVLYTVSMLWKHSCLVELLI